jgi:nucleoside-diphosphate-sugar epimerase
MIALTGGSGFVGGALVSKFGAENVITIGRTPAGASVHITADLAQMGAKALADALRPHKVTCFVHAAGVTPWANDVDFSQDLSMAEAVAGACDALRIPRLLYMSGWVVYDLSAPAPYTEETPAKPRVPYGESKLAVEAYLAAHLKTTQALSLRAATIYGPGQTSPGLIPNLVGRALQGEVLQLNAKTTRRDYLYIDDAAGAIAELAQLELPPDLHVLNIGSGTSLAVGEVAEAVQAAASAMGKTIGITYAAELTEAAPADNQLAIGAAQKLGLLQRQTPFADGLHAYMKWRSDAGIL